MKKRLTYYKETYWSDLSFRQYWKFLLAIFFLFASVGFVVDIITMAFFPAFNLILIVILTGLLAVIWVYGFTRDYRWLYVGIIVLILYFLFIWNTGELGDSAIPISQRLFIDGFGILAVVIVGYMFLVDFILNEGIQHIEYKKEIQLAREMHETLVPDIDFETEHYHIYGKSLPTTEVGGDIIDFHTSGDSLTCYIGDVSGHGVAAGVMMSMFKTSMHMGFKNQESLPESMNHSNAVLAKLKKPTMFLTAACIHLDASNQAEFVVAGHLPILHYQQPNRKISELSSGHIPLSVMAEYSYSSVKIECNPDDVFILATDGLTEVMNAKEEEFGLNKLIKNLKVNYDKAPRHIFHSILDSIRSHGKQFDDQTLLVIKVK